MAKKTIETVHRKITVGSMNGKKEIKLLEVKVGKFDPKLLEFKDTDPENRNARFYLKLDRNDNSKVQITTDIAAAYKIYSDRDQEIFIKSAKKYTININDKLNATFKEKSTFDPLDDFIVSDKPPVNSRPKKKKKKK